MNRDSRRRHSRHCLHGSDSAQELRLSQDLLGGVDEPEPLGHAGEIEQTLHLLGSPDQIQARALLAETLVRLDDHAEAGGVHELQLAEVEQEQLGLRPPRLFELGLQRRSAREVELSADRNYRRSAVRAHVYPEIALHAGPSLPICERVRHERSPGEGLGPDRPGNGLKKTSTAKTVIATQELPQRPQARDVIHEALLYRTPKVFAEQVSAFVCAGQGAGEPVLAVLPPDSLQRAQSVLAARAAQVQWTSMLEVGGNPRLSAVGLSGLDRCPSRPGAGDRRARLARAQLRRDDGMPAPRGGAADACARRRGAVCRPDGRVGTHG